MKEEKSRKSVAYLLFWPVFGLRYFLIEKFNPAEIYYPVRCSLDDRIPFLEVFIIPYIFWYFFLIGVHLWTYVNNDPVYICYSRYLILSTVISTAVFLIYPTCQELRPAVFPRDNYLTDTVRIWYRMDTNTNVCPSEHVIGSVGFVLAVCYSGRVSGKTRLAVAAAGFFTSAATVFLKQHSLVDVLAAVPVCLISGYFAFKRYDRRVLKGNTRSSD